MTTTQVKPQSMMSETGMYAIRAAVNSRRTELLNAWKRAQFAGQMDDEYGCGFWAKRIRDLNDAAIEFGMAYSLD